MRKYLLIAFALLFAVQTELPADDTKVTKAGTTAASFLEIGIGARAVGMGGAFVAMANDASALYWNPGGLARLRGVQASFSHTDWIMETSLDHAALIFPAGMSAAFGMQITTLSMDEMDVRTVFYPEGTGERFGASDVSLGLSYGMNLTDRFSVGFNGKFIQQKIWHMSASTLALDVGTLFTTQFHGLRLGMSITNFGGKMRLEGRDTAILHDVDRVKEGNNANIDASLDTDRWPLPLTFRVGIAFEVFDNESQRLSIATDAMHPNNNDESVNIGAEYAINEMLFVRGGFQSMFLEENEEGLSLGVGAVLGIGAAGRLTADYAWSDFGVLQAIHRFTLGLEF